jgi:Rieske Fe-S protein
MKASEILEGKGVTFNVGRRPIAAARVAGELIVLENVCKHEGCETEWSKKEQGWECPCHGSLYAADGTVVRGPSQADLDRLEYHLEGDEIALD